MNEQIAISNSVDGHRWRKPVVAGAAAAAMFLTLGACSNRNAESRPVDGPSETAVATTEANVAEYDSPDTMLDEASRNLVDIQAKKNGLDMIHAQGTPVEYGIVEHKDRLTEYTPGRFDGFADDIDGATHAVVRVDAIKTGPKVSGTFITIERIGTDATGADEKYRKMVYYTPTDMAVGLPVTEATVYSMLNDKYTGFVEGMVETGDSASYVYLKHKRGEVHVYDVDQELADGKRILTSVDHSQEAVERLRQVLSQ